MTYTHPLKREDYSSTLEFAAAVRNWHSEQRRALDWAKPYIPTNDDGPDFADREEARILSQDCTVNLF